MPCHISILHYQKKKQRSAVDFSTVSKVTSAGMKTRGALKQALFSQGVSDKNGTLEVIHFLPKLGSCLCWRRCVFWLHGVFVLNNFYYYYYSVISLSGSIWWCTGAGGCTETSSGLFHHTCWPEVDLGEGRYWKNTGKELDRPSALSWGMDEWERQITRDSLEKKQMTFETSKTRHVSIQPLKGHCDGKI